MRSPFDSNKYPLKLLSQLDRFVFLEKVLCSLDSKSLILGLNKFRGRGRNDYPIEILWDCLLKIVAYKLPSISALTHDQSEKIPPPSSFSHFIASCISHHHLLDELLLELADVGKIIALRHFTHHQERMSFLFDVSTGIPFLWHHGPLSESILEQATKLLEKNPFRASRFLLASSEYEPLIETLFVKYQIKPIIPLNDIKNEKKKYRGFSYQENGELFCKDASMVFVGFEEKRKTLKYRCPAIHYGYKCVSFDTCELRKGVRIPLKLSPKIFTPLPRFSYRWQYLHLLDQKLPKIENILSSSIPIIGKRAFFLRLASILFSAAYRTEKSLNLAAI